MNRLWQVESLSPEAAGRTSGKGGLRIRVHPDVHPFVRRELLTYARWLRANVAFPIRVNVYVPNALQIRALDGENCWGRCIWPEDPAAAVTIDVAGGSRATGKRALQNHIRTTIFTLSHELSHYFQFFRGIELTPRGREWQASYYAHQVMDAYYDARWDGIDDWEDE